MAPVIITVLYPNDPSTHFDMSYYLSTHMPLVQKRWSAYGLTDWRITQFSGTTDPSVPSPHSVEAKLEFESMEKFKEAGEAAGAEVFGDIPNFTDRKPVILIGETKAQM